VNVSEVVCGPSLDSVFMVMEYADHDLKAGGWVGGWVGGSTCLLVSSGWPWCVGWFVFSGGVLLQLVSPTAMPTAMNSCF
jgi:hypothetical protein